MTNRRILSLWFPRLAAERCLRLDRGLPAGPFAVAADSEHPEGANAFIEPRPRRPGSGVVSRSAMPAPCARTW